MHASENGHTDTVRWLVEEGHADVNIQNKVSHVAVDRLCGRFFALSCLLYILLFLSLSSRSLFYQFMEVVLAVRFTIHNTDMRSQIGSMTAQDTDDRNGNSQTPKAKLRTTMPHLILNVHICMSCLYQHSHRVSVTFLRGMHQRCSSILYHPQHRHEIRNRLNDSTRHGR